MITYTFFLLHRKPGTMERISILMLFCLISFTSAQFESLRNPIFNNLQRIARQQSDGECPDEQISFEMVTGYVYTAPADMLDSQPGTLMLTDCIDTCRRNSSCQSINYETGLCVLFASNADQGEGKQSSTLDFEFLSPRVDELKLA